MTQREPLRHIHRTYMNMNSEDCCGGYREGVQATEVKPQSWDTINSPGSKARAVSTRL